MRHRISGLVALLSLALVLTGSCAPAEESPEPPASPPASEAETAPGSVEATPAADGPALVADRCTVCHDTQRIEQARKSRSEWEATVDTMIGRGAQLDDTEREVVIDHLASTYPAD